MIVSSPIGELPFVPTRLRYRSKGLAMEGQMGAWPASVQIGLGDTNALLRLIAKPAAISVGAVAALALVRRLIRSS